MLDDGAARCARSKSSQRRGSRRVGALLATYKALTISESHSCNLVERDYGAVHAENINTNEERECEALHNEQWVVHREAAEFDGRVNLAAYLSAGNSNADDVRCCASERFNHGSVAQPRVHGTAQQ